MTLSRHSYLWLLLLVAVLTAIVATSSYFLAVRGSQALERSLFLGDDDVSLDRDWMGLSRQTMPRAQPAVRISRLYVFAWIILLPYYLYRTRRRRGLLFAGAILVLTVAPAAISVLARL
jgi:hypothetical protein